MSMKNEIQYTFEQKNNVGLFNVRGELTENHKDELQLLLMRALHGVDRAVLNLRDVTRIDFTCLNLLRKAYCTSLRLKSPIIITAVQQSHLGDLFNCDINDPPDSEWVGEHSGDVVT